MSKANAKNITQYHAMRQDPQNHATLKCEPAGLKCEPATTLPRLPQDKPGGYSVSAGSKGSTSEPLPYLFIIDEFAKAQPKTAGCAASSLPATTFIEGLVSVVQKGRSLGVHLILATQKPTGSVNANIWSNLKFCICLRVASLQDSRDVLGRSEAGLLPSTIPGRAYFQIGAEIFELFQSARTSLPARISNIPPSDSDRHPVGTVPCACPEEMTDMQVLMGLLEPYRASLGANLFRPWPDPLPHRIYLSDVYERSKPFVDTNTHADPSEAPPYG